MRAYRELSYVLAIFVFLFGIAHSARAQTTINIGETSVLTSADNGNANLLLGQSAVLSQAATIQSLSFYVTKAGGNLRLGIYDATGPKGGPGALKAQTNSFTPKTGWNTASVVTPVSLAAGTYWLTYLPSSNTLAFVKVLTGSTAYYSYAFGSMPSTFSTSPTTSVVHWSFYATLTTAPATPVNGQCGSSNGADLTGAPTTNLCSAGAATTVTGSGPWSWMCDGTGGGSNASCLANLLTNGLCGSANGVAVTAAPTTQLCTTGLASTVSGTGPWNWACTGTNGGTNASCSAPLLTPTNGQCGPANGVAATSTPATGLCSAGTATAVAGSGPWSWACDGSKGGTNASCSAPLKVVNGACGSSNGESFGSAPTANLCSTGSATTVTGSGPWNWMCDGSGGGANASCSAQVQPVNGTCGSSNGETLASAPTTNLCSTGTATSVTGSGPWSWMCDGLSGGTNSSCAAQVAAATVTMGQTTVLGSNDSGNANLLIVQNATLTQPATLQSISFYVLTASGTLRLGVYDAKGAGGSPGNLIAQTSSFTPKTGWNTVSLTPVLLSAGNYWLAYLPSSNSLHFALALTGAAYDASYNSSNAMPSTFPTAGVGSGAANWSLYATLSVGPTNAVCGSANGVASAIVPSANLCAIGTASAVSGNGSLWGWSCTGLYGGANASCTAPTELVNGACGSANGEGFFSAPATNLCSAGAASTVNGTGPWNWICDGLNGGTDSSACTATVAPPSTTQVVQHDSSSNTHQYDLASPYCYYFQMPEPTTAGNAMVVGFTYGSVAKATVTDDAGNTYTTDQTYYFGAVTQSIGIATAVNINGGARNLSLCFNGDPGGYVQPMATEFNNVTGVDGLTAGASGTSATASAGTLTPSQSGDLIYQIVFNTGSAASSFTPGSNMQLLSADVVDGWAGQWGINSSNSSVTPTMTLGASAPWISAAALLTVGTTGGVPSGMRIVHLLHQNVPFDGSISGGTHTIPNPLTMQVPSSGNLLVAMMDGGGQAMSSVADNAGNSWQQAGQSYVDGDTVAQVYYAPNATPSTNLTVTANWSLTQGTYTAYTILFYDIAGAATSPYDTSAGVGSNNTTPGNFTAPYTIVPATSNELILSEVAWDYNTGVGLLGQLFDTNTYNGENQSGPEPVDQNNGWGHYFAPNTNLVNFTWQVEYPSEATGAYSSMSVAFKPAQ